MVIVKKLNDRFKVYLKIKGKGKIRVDVSIYPTMDAMKKIKTVFSDRELSQVYEMFSYQLIKEEVNLNGTKEWLKFVQPIWLADKSAMERLAKISPLKFRASVLIMKYFEQYKSWLAVKSRYKDLEIEFRA